MSDLTNVHSNTAIPSEIVQTLLILRAAHTVGWRKEKNSKNKPMKSPKVQMPRWNDTISTNTTVLSTIPQTQQLQMHVYRISVQQSQCSALVMQSEANQC